MDVVVRRMAQAIQDRDPVLLQHRGDIALKYAEAALAALKPGDELGERLEVTYRVDARQEVLDCHARQAAKQMRERCAQEAYEAAQWLRNPSNIAAAIRALTLEE